MNILYIISSEGKGAGGHYNSLYQISIEVGKKHNVKIILLGQGQSPIISSSPLFDKQIKVAHSIKDFRTLNKEFRKVSSDFQPNIVHCFDTNSLNRVLLSNSFKNIPVVLNKCGGKNPLGGNYQHADAIVVFSKENQEWFLSNKNYERSNIYLIPNRVRKLNKLPKEKQVETASPKKLTFVRVSRLGGAYEKTLLQTYKLLDILSDKYQVELFVIGRIQDKNRYEKLVEIAKGKDYAVKFITDERAYKGADFLYLADFVIGTGRSFMEATSLGIPTLTPAKNTDIPILINEKNVEAFLATNFSERNIAPENSQEKTLNEIDKIHGDTDYRICFQKQTKRIFDEYFGTEKILEKYEIVYLNAFNQKIRRRKLYRYNFPYLLKYLLKGQ